MTTYTLEELAWLSRCLFPGDFKKELLAMGIDKDDSRMLSEMINTREGRGKNILELYQESLACVDPDYYTKIIDDYCKKWLDKTL